MISIRVYLLPSYIYLFVTIESSVKIVVNLVSKLFVRNNFFPPPEQTGRLSQRPWSNNLNLSVFHFLFTLQMWSFSKFLPLKDFFLFLNFFFGDTTGPQGSIGLPVLFGTDSFSSCFATIFSL